MDELVSLALRSKRQLPAAVVARIREDAELAGNRARLAAVAVHVGEPSPQKQPAPRGKDAWQLAREICDSSQTEETLDALLDGESRVTILEAVAQHADLPPRHAEALAYRDHPRIAWALLSGRPSEADPVLSKGTYRRCLQVLMDHLSSTATQPAGDDVITFLLGAGRQDDVLSCDRLPWKVLGALDVSRLPGGDVRLVSKIVSGLQGMPAAQISDPRADHHRAALKLLELVTAGPAEILIEADRLLSGLSFTEADDVVSDLHAVVELRRLSDDLEHLARTCSPDTAVELLRRATVGMRRDDLVGLPVRVGVVCNPAVDEAVWRSAFGGTIAMGAQLVALVGTAQYDRATALAARMGASRIHSALQGPGCDRERFAVMFRMLLADGYAETTHQPFWLVRCAAELGLVADVPVPVLLRSIPELTSTGGVRAADIAVSIVSALVDVAGSPDSWRTATTLAPDFPGTVGELVEATWSLST